jgi:hypothetical protein
VKAAVRRCWLRHVAIVCWLLQLQCMHLLHQLLPPTRRCRAAKAAAELAGSSCHAHHRCAYCERLMYTLRRRCCQHNLPHLGCLSEKIREACQTGCSSPDLQPAPASNGMHISIWCFGAAPTEVNQCCKVVHVQGLRTAVENASCTIQVRLRSKRTLASVFGDPAPVKATVCRACECTETMTTIRQRLTRCTSAEYAVSPIPR